MSGRVVEYVANGEYKFGLNPLFIYQSVVMGVETAVFILNCLEQSKITVFTVRNWIIVTAIQFAMGLTAALFTMVYAKWMPHQIGKEKVLVYAPTHWEKYLLFSVVVMAVNILACKDTTIQYQLFGNRLVITDFDPAQCSVVAGAVGLSGCQYDASEALSRWTASATVHTYTWLVEIVVYTFVVSSEWKPKFTREYNANRKQVEHNSLLSTVDDSQTE